MGDSPDTYSCNSIAAEIPPRQTMKHRRNKFDIFTDVVRRLRDLNAAEATAPGFEDELWAHLDRLPLGYAIEINVERAQDVLMHKRILEEARNPATAGPALEVRLVKFYSLANLKRGESVHSYLTGKVDPHCDGYSFEESIHPGPAFATSSYLKLVHEASSDMQDININGNPHNYRLMHEITLSTKDQSYIFTRLTCLLSEVGLNIHEAHAFSTTDGYILDVFYVDCRQNEGGAEQLKYDLVEEMSKLEKYPWLKDHVQNPQWKDQAKQPVAKLQNSMKKSLPLHDCEIDVRLLRFERKLTSRSNGDLYKGDFCGQDVAIKILRTQNLNENIQKEFNQEVHILRNIRHNNIVQFIGACSRPPNLCIVTEFMAGGSLYDLLRKQKGGLELPSLLGVAFHVSNGMQYLHQHNVIHRDLKAANLLLDENGVVKVADFGVARVLIPSGVMTAETGTYRWMAPEVIEHKPYNHKADVFSFGVLLWELLTGKLPYENITPLQAAVGVVHKGLRPEIPSHAHPKLVELIERCWQKEPSLRPEFSEILLFLKTWR